MRIAEKIGRGLRRAANAGELGDLVRRDIELEEGLDDGGRDRVVAASGTQRRYRSFVVAMGVAELVLRQVGMVKPGFGQIGHTSSAMLNSRADRCRLTAPPCAAASR